MTAPIDEYDEIGTFKTTPALQTKGLSLLPATVDLPDYSSWLNDPEVVKYSELRHKQHTWSDCQEYIKGFDGITNHMWSIHALGADQHIGNITLHIDEPNRVGDIGILIGAKWAWGRKYGREAWKAVETWGLKPKKDGGAGLQMLKAGHMGSNVGMKTILLKAGWEHVATITNRFILGTIYESEYIWRKRAG